MRLWANIHNENICLWVCSFFLPKLINLNSKDRASRAIKTAVGPRYNDMPKVLNLLKLQEQNVTKRNMREKKLFKQHVCYEQSPHKKLLQIFIKQSMIYLHQPDKILCYVPVFYTQSCTMLYTVKPVLKTTCLDRPPAL